LTSGLPVVLDAALAVKAAMDRSNAIVTASGLLT
jgi:hypothetical protein